MDLIYFRDPLGQLYELASYRFEPPPGRSHAEVLLEAHQIRVARGDYNIAEVHLADAIEQMILRDRKSLSSDRAPKDPYAKAARPRKDQREPGEPAQCRQEANARQGRRRSGQTVAAQEEVTPRGIVDRYCFRFCQNRAPRRIRPAERPHDRRKPC